MAAEFRAHRVDYVVQARVLGQNRAHDEVVVIRRVQHCPELVLTHRNQ